MKKILLTGFDPFGGELVNPAWEAVKLIKAPQGLTLVKLQVPTVFALSGETVMEAVRREKPYAVVCIGQALGRNAVTPERVAINVDDGRIADNAGMQPVDEPIRADGPAAYFATLPVKKMVEAIKAAGYPGTLSNSAGTFVCNHLMYALLDGLAREFPEVKGGFIHVPGLPEQAERAGSSCPSLELQAIVGALEAALGVLAEDV